MIPDLSITGPLGWVLLILPPTALCLVIIATLPVWRRAATGGAGSVDLGPNERPAEAPVARALSHPAEAGARAEPAGGPAPQPGPAAFDTISATPDVAPEPAVKAPVRSVFAVRELIAEAEETQDRPALARLCLDQARILRTGGEIREAGDLIRKSILLAIELKDDVLHARGRLELGEIAEELGDLTTACEHWQMARSLFTETNNEAESDRVVDRMLSRGCPTDWVLTDF